MSNYIGKRGKMLVEMCSIDNEREANEETKLEIGRPFDESITLPIILITVPPPDSSRHTNDQTVTLGDSDKPLSKELPRSEKVNVQDSLLSTEESCELSYFKNDITNLISEEPGIFSLTEVIIVEEPMLQNLMYSPEKHNLCETAQENFEKVNEELMDEDLPYQQKSIEEDLTVRQGRKSNLPKGNDIDSDDFIIEEGIAKENLENVNEELMEEDLHYQQESIEEDLTVTETNLPEGSDIDSDEFNIDEGRKRKRKPTANNWLRNKNKVLRERGQNYIGFAKNDETNRYQQNQPRAASTTCRSKFCQKSKLRACFQISEESGQMLFNKFWNEMSWEQRKMFVINNVSRISVKRRYTKNANSTRNFTLLYHLLVENKKISVCQKLFLSTLSLGEFQVNNWLKNSSDGMCIAKQVANSRKSMTRRKKFGGGDKEFLIQFFDSLAKLPSHYCRKTTTKLYLDQSILTITQLYKEYSSNCETNNKKPMCRKSFDDVFSEKNLSIFHPKKDKCDLCSQFEVGNLDEDIYKTHVTKKDRARQELSNDVSLAKANDWTVLTMDLQAVKVCPTLYASAVYYKTKLCCHNFTVMNVATKHVMCSWFTEIEADLSASTFVSLIRDYISNYTTGRVIIFSDGCTYQNRNNVLANALLSLAVEKNVLIEQKYLERGHTQMHCDSVHSKIKTKMKGMEILLPSTFLSITKEARKNPFQYETKWVELDSFRNYSQKQDLVYQSIRPGKKHVIDIRAIRYNPNGTIFYKLHFDDEWQELPQRKQRPTPVITWPQMNLRKLPLNPQKWKHLQELKAVIPADCHQFYDSIAH